MSDSNIMRGREARKLIEDRKDKDEQKKVWDEIAEGWSDWRQAPFPEVKKFIEENVRDPGAVLDIGCGNGRNLIPFAQRGFKCYGIDFSPKMIKLAREFFERKKLSANFKVANAVKIPFKSEFFDYCISTAVIHHLQTDKERREALLGIRRVLKEGGKALLMVWNKYGIGNWNLMLKPKETYIPWRRKGKTYWRYYYLFNFFEFKRLVEECGFKIISSGGIFDRNIMFVVKK